MIEEGGGGKNMYLKFNIHPCEILLTMNLLYLVEEPWDFDVEPVLEVGLNGVDVQEDVPVPQRHMAFKGIDKQLGQSPQ